MSWMLEGDYLEGTVTCHASEGADCRVTCTQGCESWDCTDHEHPLVDDGKCNFVEWAENDGILYCHHGSHAPTDGFIEPDWNGDHYTWSYSHV